MALNLPAQKATNAPCDLNTCKICMKSLPEMTTIVLHPCGHPFHQKCIETYTPCLSSFHKTSYKNSAKYTKNIIILYFKVFNH